MTTDANEMNAIDDVQKHEADDEADDEHADGSESGLDGIKPKDRDGSISDGDGDGDGDEGPSVLRARGNELFARGEFAKASMMYTMALKAAARTLIGEDEASNSGYGDESKKKRSLSMKKRKMMVMAMMMEEEVLSLSNRAEIWLRLGEHGKALEDAEAAIASIHEHHRLLRDLSQHHHHHHHHHHPLPRANEDLAMAKALFRKARALMGLWRCHEALPLLHSLQHLSKDPELFRAIATCKSSLAHHQAMKKKNKSKKNRKKAADEGLV
jgi:tetratricopeptide (TPR) repeat protein